MIKKTGLIILLIILGNVILKGQGVLKYYTLENNFESYWKSKDTLVAIKSLDSALEMNLPICDYYLGFKINHILKDYKKAEIHLKALANQGVDMKLLYENSKNYKYLNLESIDSNEINSIYHVDINTISHAKYIRYNLNYMNKIHELYTKDQFIRSLYNQLKYDEDTIHLNYVLEVGKRVDSTNFYELLSLYKSYGLPNGSNLPEACISEFLLVLTHQLDSNNPKIREQSFGILLEFKKGVISGKYRNESYANAVDRMYHNLHKKNYYGKFYLESYEFEDFDHIDSLRAEIGLLPIKSKFIKK